jgi:hypothetical protein
MTSAFSVMGAATVFVPVMLFTMAGSARFILAFCGINAHMAVAAFVLQAVFSLGLAGLAVCFGKLNNSRSQRP